MIFHWLFLFEVPGNVILYRIGARIWIARIVASFMAAISLSGVIGGPLPSWVMEAFAGKNGWADWQWLFLVEAASAALIGASPYCPYPHVWSIANLATERQRNVLLSTRSQAI